MRIILTFFWIIVVAIILWFFAENLDQSVSIDMFGRQYEQVNLVTVIFISTFMGVFAGVLIMIWKLIKSKAQVSSLKKEIKRLTRDLDLLKQSQIGPQEQGTTEYEETE